MKWNGIVSQSGQSCIATRFAAAKANHAASTALRRNKPIAAMSHGLDGVRPELLPKPADADLDDVRARVEVVPPDVREQALAADDLAFVQDEVVQEPELAVGERRDDLPELRLSPRDIERQQARPHDAAVLAGPPAPQLRPHARKELVEREGLRQVAAGAEVEAAQLRLELGAGRHDHDRQLREPVLDLPQGLEAVELREQQGPDPEVVAPAHRAVDPGLPVTGPVDRAALRLDGAREERQNPRLVLDDQDAHASPFRRGTLTQKI